MGRLYQKSVSGDKTLAYFEAGQVRSEKCPGAALVYYDSGGYIYKGRDTQVLATCGSDGQIHRGRGLNGSVLAKCEDGQIHSIGSDLSVLAWYDGDMYGAAAAAVVIVLGLGTS